MPQQPMSIAQSVNQAYPDDEISLIELWDILVKRKALIVLFFVLCVVGGAAFAYLQAPVYEASVKLRIGQVVSQQIENADELSSRLIALHGEDVATGVKRPRPFLTKAAAQRGVATTIELVAEGDHPEDAARLLTEVMEEIKANHSDIYQRNMTLLTERLANLDLQGASLQKQYENASQLMERLSQQDAVQASFMMMELSRISTLIRALDSEQPALAQKLLPPQTRPTELLGKITAPAKPSKPKKALILALSAVLGVMGGVMLAFVAEFAAKSRGAARA
ncbi:Wzz/FepE/Etk N-terminal domain-containing protein [Rhodocyclaceae bacterium SMB388]